MEQRRPARRAAPRLPQRRPPGKVAPRLGGGPPSAAARPAGSLHPSLAACQLTIPWPRLRTRVQAERALAAHRRLSAATLTARHASVLFSPADPLRPLMDIVLQLADSAGARPPRRLACGLLSLGLRAGGLQAALQMRGCFLGIAGHEGCGTLRWMGLCRLGVAGRAFFPLLVCVSRWGKNKRARSIVACASCPGAGRNWAARVPAPLPRLGRRLPSRRGACALPAGPTFVPDTSVSVPEESDLDVFDRCVCETAFRHKAAASVGVWAGVSARAACPSSWWAGWGRHARFSGPIKLLLAEIAVQAAAAVPAPQHRCLPRPQGGCRHPAASHTPLPSHTPPLARPRLPFARRADLARLRRELKAALMDWEREQALYAEVRSARALRCARYRTFVPLLQPNSLPALRAARPPAAARALRS